MNEVSGAEAMVRLLQLYGVKHIFGLCGDTSLPFYDALHRLDHGMEHVLTRDERSAAYMADAYARVTGRVGVCEGPSGGGATYILPGLVEANESSIPVLGITSDISVTSRGKYALTELDQRSLFRPLTKWNTVIERADMLPAAVRTAFRAMTTGKPGSTHIGLPFDVQKGAVDPDDIWVQPEHGAYPAWRSGPNPDDVARAVEIMRSARRPLFICGGGAVISGASDVLSELAELLGAPVATTISGQGSLAETHSLCLGVVGSNGGTAPTRNVVRQSDLIIFVGCRAGSVTTERWSYPRRGVSIIHIDIDPSVISANYPTAVGLVGDARLILTELKEALERSPAGLDRGGSEARHSVAEAKREKQAAFLELARSAQTPILPERVVSTLQEVLPRDAIVVCDPGTPCPYLSAYYELQESGRHFITNRAHGALGYSLSAVVGAWYGRPGTKCVAVMGDGSFCFTVGELETIRRLNIPVMLIVLSNGSYGWIKAGQKSGFGGRFFSVDFGSPDYVGIAEGFGLKAWSVRDPGDLRGILAKAAECSGPCLVEIVTQPLEEANAPVSEWIA